MSHRDVVQRETQNYRGKRKNVKEFDVARKRTPETLSAVFMDEGNKYVLTLKRIVADFLKDEEIKIVLFGSRARGDNYHFSDVDIGILPYRKIEQKKITLLRERLEDLNIPYKIEIVNLSEVSEDFKNMVLQEAIVWKD